MLGLGADREILRIYLQCRLLLAGAHAARPRHPRRLRAIEIGDREIVGARAAGAARHGDDGLIRMARGAQGVIARSAATKQSRVLLTTLDCFASLAMTVKSGSTSW